MFRALLLLLPAAASAAPCVTTNCTEWVPLGGGARSLIYITHPLNAKHASITRALIVIHGQGRNADDYFRTGAAAAFLAGALDNTVVIAPRFASKDGKGCQDSLGEHEVNWRCSGDSWRSGAASVDDAHLTSYDFMDEILRRLASKSAFPNLKTIVVAGHSAGGQYVSRYLMTNRVHESLAVPVTYVVSNPSSYAYLDTMRPAGEHEYKAFAEAAKCAAYDQWPYGLEGRSGYSAKESDSQLRKQIAARPVTYLLGELDTLPIAGFDSSCSAMAQGPSRLARGQAYAEYIKKFGAKHKVVTVPLCGHNARCVFTADPALAVLFPQ